MRNEKRTELGAGQAFVQAHSAAELQAIQQALQVGAAGWEARIRAAWEEARIDLEAHGFALPRSIEEYQELALAVGLPEPVVWSGDFTLGDLRPLAARWAALARARLLQDRAGATIARAFPGILEAARTQPDELVGPKHYLLSWRAITDALELPRGGESKHQVARLNDQYVGPIISLSKGGQPRVEKQALIAWWNRLAILWADTSNQRKGGVLEANTQHPYGQKGLVVPGLQGGVRPRRGEGGAKHHKS